MTRIRYTLNENGVLVSKPVLVNGPDAAVVNIMPATKQYIIISSNGSIVAQSKVYNSLNDVKKAAKECLKLMGAHFDDEVRRKDE